ncbi:hypothetical protein IMG5_015510 [Ichthyophthirius multifiliis]|uniref:START domain-containing protein n=1 Tax=Ichthyophthirius multifiliis TaxID=5932 RepID=G0QKB4_ICHMU|nr:hypothetical protein IMG5_015510 [Ichthyophthirius multifiliis]EGR34344.1 hypothetical protein IMG5_015510 [Ichthyophthirius multifiliis]|eukprot:XP_004039648.1 hypothetical protein IMG5_015510 [Ichthyophthirius multifiliis]
MKILMFVIFKQKKIDDNNYIIIKPDLKEHYKFQPTKGCVRGEIIVQGIALQKVDENKTIVDQYFLLDPKGSIPTSLISLTVQLELIVQEKAEKII